MSRLDEIEAIVTELERLDKETRGQYRQFSDTREAIDVIDRMLRTKRRETKTSE